MCHIQKSVSHKERVTHKGSDTHTHTLLRIKHDIITPLRKPDWDQREKKDWDQRENNVKKLYGGVCALVQKEDKYFIYNGECTICLDNDASEAEVITDLNKPRRVNYQIHSRSEQNAEYWIHSSATQDLILADRVYATRCTSLCWKNARQLVPRQNKEVTSRNIWSLVNSTFSAILEEPRSKLQV